VGKFGTEELEWRIYLMLKKFENMFIRNFNTETIM